jgi:polyribonucleotide nucleotidyltransferase
VVFVAAQCGPPRPGIDFFPLTVDYRERSAAAGKFPGGFLKREGRPTLKEILTSRLVDRPVRPLFPEGYADEVQIMANVLACDGENDPDVLAIIGASAALSVAPTIPFQGPLSGIRVGLFNEQFTLMPKQKELETSALDLVLAGTNQSVLMIEGFGDQLPEEQMVDALMFGHRAIREICELQEELVRKVGVPSKEMPVRAVNPLVELLRSEAYGQFREAKTVRGKQDRADAINAVKQHWKDKLFPNGAEVTSGGVPLSQFETAMHDLEYRVVRDLALEGKRPDGRGTGDLRAVSCHVGVIPRVHGSAIFTRGETQSLVTVALGTVRDEQRVDGLFEEYSKRFMLDYYFPPYSVGECRPIRGPGRREIGHGALAERSVERVLPAADKFPIKQPVAGISIGLVKEPDRFVLLTDIIGDEDHFGDMDFKVAGTGKGITGIQLDLKIDGINEQIIRETLAQAKTARLDLLRSMLTAIARPKKEISAHAPRLVRTKIDPQKIGLLIGPGGKTIRLIQEETGTTLDVTDDGTVTISGPNQAGVDDALARVEALTEEIKVGKIYNGVVSSIKDFGAFIEIVPGKDGLCHISELSDGYVKSVSDVCKEGDRMQVKVIAVDDQNRVKLSRKAVLAEMGKGESSGSSN